MHNAQHHICTHQGLAPTAPPEEALVCCPELPAAQGAHAVLHAAKQRAHHLPQQLPELTPAIVLHPAGQQDDKAQRDVKLG
jgi:hypothetical protein